MYSMCRVELWHAHPHTQTHTRPPTHTHTCITFRLIFLPMLLFFPNRSAVLPHSSQLSWTHFYKLRSSGVLTKTHITYTSAEDDKQKLISAGFKQRMGTNTVICSEDRRRHLNRGCEIMTSGSRRNKMQAHYRMHKMRRNYTTSGEGCRTRRNGLGRLDLHLADFVRVPCWWWERIFFTSDHRDRLKISQVSLTKYVHLSTNNFWHHSSFLGSQVS